jgi:hypothetical protein
LGRKQFERTQGLKDSRLKNPGIGKTAVAAELAGYAGEFRCFLERRLQKQFVSIPVF